MRVEDRKTESIGCGLGVEAIFVSGKVPTYVKKPPTNCDGAAVAYKVIDCATGSSLLYVPAIRQIDERFIAAAAECDCLLFDGSFWSENEMEFCRVGTRTASAMGHVPISGRSGSLARLGVLRLERSTLMLTTPIPFSTKTRPSAVRSTSGMGSRRRRHGFYGVTSRCERYA